MNECRYFDKCYDMIDGVGLVRCDGKGVLSTVSNHPICKCSDYEPMVNRDKLLALADELERSALESGKDGDELVLSRGAAFHYSHCIREALGVSDGA